MWVPGKNGISNHQISSGRETGEQLKDNRMFKPRADAIPVFFGLGSLKHKPKGSGVGHFIVFLGYD